MIVNFTTEQTAGLQAACDHYNTNYKTALTVDQYTEMICQELAMSMINMHIKAYTPAETLASQLEVATLQAAAPAPVPAPAPVIATTIV